jgi:hypothetical protein
VSNHNSGPCQGNGQKKAQPLSGCAKSTKGGGWRRRKSDWILRFAVWGVISIDRQNFRTKVCATQYTRPQIIDAKQDSINFVNASYL